MESKFKRLAENGQIKKALAIIEASIKLPVDGTNVLSSLKSRLNRLEIKLISGNLNTSEYEIAYNKIYSSFLSFIELYQIETDHNSNSILSQIEFNHEKIINGNTFYDISWLKKGIHSSNSVGIIKNCEMGTFGTGFLIKNNLVITNNHVIQNKIHGASCLIDFNYLVENNPFEDDSVLKLNPEYYFKTSIEFDYTIIGIDIPENKNIEPLVLSNKAAKQGDFVTIIQHPKAGPKKIVTNGSRIVNIYNSKLQYTTDTLPGSSGSPVFNDEWHIVGLHHAGGNLQIDKKGNSLFINQGISINAILKDINN